MLSRFNIILDRDGQTDGWTDGRTPFDIKYRAYAGKSRS